MPFLFEAYDIPNCFPSSGELIDKLLKDSGETEKQRKRRKDQEECERRAAEEERRKQEETAQRKKDMERSNERLERSERALREELERLKAAFESLNAEMKQKKIETFEQLANHDSEAKERLVQLAQQAPRAELSGVHIAVLGSTSVGKSTLINAFLRQNVAETGYCETTTKITSYSGIGYTLWDFPGRNDEISYLNMDFFSLMKASARRLIVIQATPNENSNLMKLLDKLGLEYDIVLNKFDFVKLKERALVKEKIPDGIKTLGLQKVGKVYFVSAENPYMFEDWHELVHHVTGRQALP